MVLRVVDWLGADDILGTGVRKELWDKTGYTVPFDVPVGVALLELLGWSLGTDFLDCVCVEEVEDDLVIRIDPDDVVVTVIVLEALDVRLGEDVALDVFDVMDDTEAECVIGIVIDTIGVAVCDRVDGPVRVCIEE